MVRSPLGVGLALGVEVAVAPAVGLAAVGELVAVGEVVAAGELVGAACSVTSGLTGPGTAGFTSGRAEGRLGMAGFRF
jgi:hypothetical protein